MSYAVDVLAAYRGLLADRGSLIVGDERVPDTFDTPRATRSSVSTTGSSTACPSEWSAKTQPGPER